MASPRIPYTEGNSPPKASFCLLELHNHFHRAKISPVEYQLHLFFSEFLT